MPLPRRWLAAATLLLPLLPASAMAAAASASQDVNVRSGPATTYGIIGKLQQGETVDVTQCEGTFCAVSFGEGQRGWVAAGYLTRDAVPPAVAPDSAPQVAATGSGPRAAYPPAYDPTGSATAGSSVTLPPDSGERIAGTDEPRPRIDIPEDRSAGDLAEAPDDGYDAGPPPDNDWYVGPGIGWRNHWDGFGPRPRYAGLDRARPAEACFFGGSYDGASGFCLSAGQSVSELGTWSDRIYSVRNPRGLKVTICSDGRFHDCRVYDSSGPVMLPRDAGVASISVDPPDGY